MEFGLEVAGGAGSEEEAEVDLTADDLVTIA